MTMRERKVAFYSCRVIINEHLPLYRRLYAVECPEEWKGIKIMSYEQIRHWRITGELKEIKTFHFPSKKKMAKRDFPFIPSI